MCENKSDLLKFVTQLI